MKVLHIGKYFPPCFGGMETFLHDLCRAQAGAGQDVAVLVHNHLGHQTSREEFPVERGSIQVIRAGTLGKLLFTPVSPLFPVVLKRAIDQLRPDILHLHLPNPSAFWVMLLPSARKIPWVVHWHADVVSSEIDRRVKLAYGFYRPFEQALLRRCSRVIATSQPYLDSSLPLTAWHQKSEVVPLGMSAFRLGDGSRDRLNPGDLWKSGPFRVIAVGRLTYYKGFEYLVQAAAQLPEVQIKIVGEGEKEPELKQLIGKLAVADRVELMGGLPDEDLGGLMASCDCLCLPSVERTEAFGMVLLEAMYFARPVVISDVAGSGMGWVVLQNETGLKVPPADVSALATAIKTLVDDRGRARALGVQGRRRFDETFDIARVAEQTDSLYHAVLHSAAPNQGSQ